MPGKTTQKLKRPPDFYTDQPGGPGGHNHNYGNNAPDNNLGLAAQLLAEAEALTMALTTLATSARSTSGSGKAGQKAPAKVAKA